MVPCKFLRGFGTAETHDLAAQLVGAAHVIVDTWPGLPELVFAGHDHRGVGLEAELGADAVAGMCGEEELEALLTEVCIGELEALRIECVDHRVGHDVFDALDVADEEAAPGTLESEVREGLRGLAEAIGGVVFVDKAAVVVVLDVGPFDEGLEG